MSSNYLWDKSDYDCVRTIGGGLRYVKKKSKLPKVEISYEDFIRDDDGNIVLKSKRK